MFSKLLAGSTVALSVSNALAAGVAWGGVNIAGFDFGCDTTGNCQISGAYPPADGAAQMKHFVDVDKFNVFRLPVGWQYLVNGQLGGTLDAGNLAKYDGLVQGCLTTGAYCLIDIHNYARWNGQIIGQGGPTDDQFASLWSQLAKKYAAESKVVMGLMNEPHDIPDMSRWATSVQAAVTAIRRAGATTQTILLPGNDYTSAQTFAKGSGPVLSKVTNPDGSTTNLVFDVHKYFDSDNSGTHANCVGNQIQESFAPLANWLRTSKRQALLSETGGGSNDPSCLTNVCDAFDFLNKNSDVYLGYLGWAAGSFSASAYGLALTPIMGDHGYTDQQLMKQCFAAKFASGSGVGPAPAPSSTSAPSAPAPSSSSSSAETVSTGSPASSASVPTESTTSTTSQAPATPIPSGVFPPGYGSSTDIPPYPTAPLTFVTVVKPTSTSGAVAEEKWYAEGDDDETCEA